MWETGFRCFNVKSKLSGFVEEVLFCLSFLYTFKSCIAPSRKTLKYSEFQLWNWRREENQFTYVNLKCPLRIWKKIFKFGSSDGSANECRHVFIRVVFLFNIYFLPIAIMSKTSFLLLKGMRLQPSVSTAATLSYSAKRQNHYDIAIAGGGLVGTAMACAVGKYNMNRIDEVLTEKFENIKLMWRFRTKHQTVGEKDYFVGVFQGTKQCKKNRCWWWLQQ